MLSEVNGPVEKTGSTAPGSQTVVLTQSSDSVGFSRPTSENAPPKSVAEKHSDKIAEDKAQLEERLQSEVTQAQRDFQYTAVKFSSSKDSEFRFSIVERETGKVLREFPPGEANKASTQGKLATGKGLLHESTA